MPHHSQSFHLPRKTAQKHTFATAATRPTRARRIRNVVFGQIPIWIYSIRRLVLYNLFARSGMSFLKQPQGYPSSYLYHQVHHQRCISSNTCIAVLDPRLTRVSWPLDLLIITACCWQGRHVARRLPSIPVPCVDVRAALSDPESSACAPLSRG